MTKRKGILIAFVISILLACFSFRNEGVKHVLPNSELRWAREKWSNGEHFESMKWFVVANTSAINAGFRWSIARLYFKSVITLEEQEKWEEALVACGRTVRILNGYDDEGSTDYHCLELRERIERQEQPDSLNSKFGSCANYEAHIKNITFRCNTSEGLLLHYIHLLLA